MNKISLGKLAFSVAAVTASLTTYAGDMGPKTPPTSMPYFAGEASYNWRQIDGPRLNGFSPARNNQNWGGRISGGILHFNSNNFGVTGEIGGGYYGSTKLAITPLATSAKLSVDGYDALIGILYKLTNTEKLEKFDVFAKIGFMAQNLRINAQQTNLQLTNGGALISGSTNNKSITIAMLPEVRVGTIYNARDDLGITLTYMHAFGSNFSSNTTKAATFGQGIVTNQVADIQNPSLDSIMLGLRYYVV